MVPWRFARISSAVLLAGILVGSAAVARADEPSVADRAKARKLLDSANTHYTLGEWKAAVTDYKECYRLVHNAVLLFNLGQAYRQDGDFENAVMFYRSYLRDQKTAENRADVEKLIKDTEAAAATKKASPAINPTARSNNVDDSWTSNTAAPSAPTKTDARISVRDIRVMDNGVWKGEPSMRFDILDVAVGGYRGKNIHFGFDVKQGGKRLTWVGSTAETVSSDKQTWPASKAGIAKTYYFNQEHLRQKGDAGQPYEGVFYVVDAVSQSEIFSRSVSFQVPAKSAAPVVAAPAATKGRITVAAINVDVSSSDGTESAVKLDVIDVGVFDQQGMTIHFGFNVKQNGKFLQWQSRNAEEVQSNAAHWKGATTFFYKRSFLQQHGDVSQPFYGYFYVMETFTRRELFWKEVKFSLQP